MKPLPLVDKNNLDTPHVMVNQVEYADRFGLGGASRRAPRRLAWVDVAKGIAILSILLHHIEFKDSAGNSVFANYVSLYDVAVFFLVAGFFASPRKCIGEFVIDKARRLLLPYILTCLVIGVYVVWCKFVYGSPEGYTQWNTVKDFGWAAVYGVGVNLPSMPKGVGHIGAIWFLEAMFVAMVEIRLVLGRYGERPLIAATIVGLLATVSLVLKSHFYIPCNVEQGLVGGAFVCLGWLYKRYVGLDGACTFDAALLLAFVFLFSAKFGIRPSFVGPTFKDGLLTVAASLCACRLTLALSKVVDARLPTATRALAYFGRNSLMVLCVHLVCLDCRLSRGIAAALGAVFSVSANTVSAISLIVQIVLSILMIRLVQQSRFLRGIFC